jgi:hypothetical protein
MDVGGFLKKMILIKNVESNLQPRKAMSVETPTRQGYLDRGGDRRGMRPREAEGSMEGGPTNDQRNIGLPSHCNPLLLR